MVVDYNYFPDVSIFFAYKSVNISNLEEKRKDITVMERLSNENRVSISVHCVH